MFGHIPQSTREALNRAFPERQIIHRTGGQVHCFNIGQRSQIIASTGIALVAGWCLFSFASLALGNNPFGSMAKDVRRLEAQFERQLIDAQAKEANARRLLEAQQREFTQAAASFEQKHRTLKQILGGGVLSDENDLSLPTNYVSQTVLMAPVTRDRIERRSRVEAIDTEEAAVQNLPGASLTGLSTDQNDILIEAENNALSSIELNRAVIRSAGLDVDEVLRSGPFGQGGPLVTNTDAGTDEGNFGSRIDSIRARVSEADALNRAMISMPFGQPILQDHYQTSAYGPRKDPFTKRTAFHQGVDFGGAKMTEIVATAPGKVSYVGMNGGYGRVVEIEHDHGIKTRYAHLAKTYVKRGQNIVTGEKIGGMGSTGRSTSTHLHYEVMFQGRQTDPGKFMKASQYVQQK